MNEPKLNFTVLQTTSTDRVVTVKVPAQVVKQILDEKIKAVQKTASLPGFRKGKAPASVIRSRWLDQILEEIKVRLIEGNTPTVMEQEQVGKKTVVGEPAIKKAKISEKKGLSYEIHLKTRDGASMVNVGGPSTTDPGSIVLKPTRAGAGESHEPGSVVDFSKPAPPIQGKG